MKNAFTLKTVEGIFVPLGYKISSSKTKKKDTEYQYWLRFMGCHVILNKIKIIKPVYIRCNITQKEPDSILFRCLFSDYGHHSVGEVMIKLFYEDGIQISDFNVYADEDFGYEIITFKHQLEDKLREKLKADNKLFKEVFDDV
jgi:hypothetical protein